MKIAVIAHIRHPIAEPFKGGMETHTKLLCDGLRRAGHRVTLFASSGSQDENLHAICGPYDAVLPWEQYRGTVELADYQAEAFEIAKQAILREDFDVVHNNSLFAELIGWCADMGIPCVTSQHVPPFQRMAEAVASVRDAPGSIVTVPSRSQAEFWAASGCGNLHIVPNGVDTARWHPGETVGDYFSWCGRITANKGLSRAVRAASLGGFALRIYGPIEDEAYFTDEIVPFLTDAIQYRGHFDAARLREELAAARGALVTPMWDEPFGLVAAEALSCGVPVAAFDRGAIREVVGECGILVAPGDYEALAKAMANLPSIDRTECRKRAVEHLSVDAMICAYEECYQTAISGSAAASADAARRSRYSRTEALLANG